MKKERCKPFVLILFILISIPFFSTSVSADLQCEVINRVSKACANTDVFHISSPTNAHAELATQSNYKWSVCCGLAEDRLNTDCTAPDTKVTSLFSPKNAHVEIPGYTSYANDVCLSAQTGKIICDQKQSCFSPPETCVFKQSSNTNAHAADCGTNPYKLKTCCVHCPANTGGLNQPCCAGVFCDKGLACNGGTCKPFADIECGNGQLDRGETCDTCPQDLISLGLCPDRCWIHGNIKNTVDEALKGVTVKVTVGSAKYSSSSDALGNYMILGPPQGTRDVVAGKQYYANKVETVVCTGGEGTEQNLVLSCGCRGPCHVGCTAPQHCFGTIAGNVKDTNNKNVEFAKIKFMEGATEERYTLADSVGDYPNSEGYYPVNDIMCGTYNMIASAPTYISSTKSGIILEPKGSVTVNFDDLVLGTTCESDCTYAGDNLIHKGCDGINGCVFYGDTAKMVSCFTGETINEVECSKKVCELAQPGWRRDYNATHELECPKGPLLEKVTVKATVTCDEGNLIKVTKIVKYKGKLAKLNVVTCG